MMTGTAGTVYASICGESNKHHYTLNLHETDNVQGTGRKGYGLQFKSDASRRLISDHWEWFESKERRDILVARYLSA
jgi:hypothetical protein